MYKLYETFITRYPITLLGVIFIGCTTILGFLPFYITLPMALLILVIGLFKFKELWPLCIFKALIFVSAVLSNMVIDIEPKIMLGMFAVALLILASTRFPKMIASTMLLSFLIIAYFFFSYTILAIPTSLIAIMAIFSTWLLYRDKLVLLKK